MSVPRRMVEPSIRGSAARGDGHWLVGVSGSLAVWVMALRVFEKRTTQHIAEQLPEIALRLARALRVGETVDEALRSASHNTDAVPPALVRIVRQLADGRGVVDALQVAATDADSDAERLLWTSLVVGMVHGGDLAGALDVVGDGLRSDIDLAARRRLLVGQATLSAGVLVVMPIAFAVAASVLRGSFVFRGTAGVGLLAAGLALDGLGGLWMRSLLGRLR